MLQRTYIPTKFALFIRNIEFPICLYWRCYKKPSSSLHSMYIIQYDHFLPRNSTERCITFVWQYILQILIMEIELFRVDYTIVGLTQSNCMKLLPVCGPQETQRVITK